MKVTQIEAAQADPSSILSLEDIAHARTPDELKAWLFRKFQDFERSDDAKRYLRLRRGLSKKLVEELLPLSLLGAELQKGGAILSINPTTGNESYDAIVNVKEDEKWKPYLVEVTVAIDGHDDSLRMEHLNRHGRVSLTNPIIGQEGTRKTGRSLRFVNIAANGNDLREKVFNLVYEAARSKAEKQYPKHSWLLVGFEDILGFTDASHQKELLYVWHRGCDFLLNSFSRAFLVGLHRSFFAELRRDWYPS